MKTTYRFKGTSYNNFADLCNAYFAEKGYYPTNPASVNATNNVLYY